MIVTKLLAVDVLIPLLILIVPNVYASRQLSDSHRYNDGFSNGSDAAATDLRNGTPFNAACDPNGTFTSGGGHTATYCNGWSNGYTSTYNGGGGGSPRTITPGVTGGSRENFASECNPIQPILVQSCSDLVNPDGSLTADGSKANTCIRNGIVLGLGGLLITGGNITPVITALQILSSRTGCDGVVNWNFLDLGQLNLLKRIFG